MLEGDAVINARDDATSEIVSVDRCSSATVQSVDLLLNGTQNENKTPLTGPGRSEDELSRRGASNKGRSGFSQRGQNRVGTREGPGYPLSAKNAHVFATEVVNAVLQSLTEVAKRQTGHGMTQIVGPRKEGKACPSSDKLRALSSTTPISEKSENRKPPLQTRQDKTPTTNRASKKKIKEDSTTAVAECGCLAFAFLKAHRSIDQRGTRSSDWRLEHGILAFIGKLIGLELGDIAGRELGVLRTSLEHRTKDDADTPTAPVGSSKNTAKMWNAKRTANTAAYLFEFPDEVPRQESSRVVIQYQMLVLRYVALCCPVSDVSAVLEYMSTERTCSPINLILRLSKSHGEADWPSKQLELIAQYILSLSARYLRAVSCDENYKKNTTAAETFLELQALGFRTRLEWMKLSAHKCNVNEEIAYPFANCLAIVKRTWSQPSAELFGTASAIFSALNAAIKAHEESAPATAVACSGFGKVCDSLSEMAREARLFQEAQHWAKQALKHDNEDGSSRERPSVIWRLGTLALQNATSKDDLQDSLRPSLELLAKNPKPSDNDMEQMICAALELRNAAADYLKSSKGTAGEEQGVCQQVLCCVVRFLVDCLKHLPPKPPSEKDSRYPHCALLIYKAGPSSIEYVVASHLRMAMTCEDDFAYANDAFKICMEFLKALLPLYGSELMTASPQEKSLRSCYVKISNAYWSLHHKIREQLPRASLMSLKRCCDVLALAPVEEQKEANLPHKLDQLGRAFQIARRFDDAKSAFVHSIRNSIVVGVLDDAHSLIDHPFAQRISKIDARLATLSETLSTLLEGEGRYKFGLPNGAPFYDDENLELAKRGLLLEWQFALIHRWLSSKPLIAHGKLMASPLGSRLLDLYNRPEHSLWRHRVSLQVLRLSSDVPGSIEPGLLKVAEECAIACTNTEFNGADALNKGWEQLKLLLMIALALRGVLYPAEKFDVAISNLINVFDRRRCTPKPEERLTEIDELSLQAQSLVDYFGSRGFGFHQLSALRLRLELQWIRNPFLPEGCIKALLDTGLSLMRLGYSEEAGMHLAKAKSLMASLDPAKDVVIAYNLAYAEYYYQLLDHKKAFEYLGEARDYLRNDPSSLSEGGAMTRNVSKLLLVCQTADLFHLLSLMSAIRGPHMRALWYARRETLLLQSAWKALENQRTLREMDEGIPADNDPDLIEAFSHLKMSTTCDSCETEKNLEHVFGPRFWRLGPRLPRALTHLAKLFSQDGLSMDASHHLDEAHRLTKHIVLESLQAKIVALKGDYLSRSGKVEDGKVLFNQAETLYSGTHESKDLAWFYQALGHSHRLQGRWDEELGAYDRAKNIINNLPKSNLVRKLREDGRLTENPENASPVRRNKSKSFTKSHANPVHREPRQPKSSKNMDNEVNPKPSTSLTACSNNYHQLSVVLKELLHLRAESLLLQGQPKECRRILGALQQDYGHFAIHAQQQILHARLLIQEASEMMLQDAVTSMLAESALSLPAVAHSGAEKSSRDNCAATHAPRIAPSRRQQPKSQSETAVESSLRHISEAIDICTEIHNALAHLNNLSTIRQASSVLASASMLMEFAQAGSTLRQIQPVSVAFAIDLPQCVAASRDRAASLVYNTAKQMDQFDVSEECGILNEWEGYEPSNFQRDFVQIIPEEWTCISLSLDENKEHLRVTRYQAGRTPFLLRLPLSRHSAQDLDEEIFTFEEARAEITQIIEASDATVHLSKDDAERMKTKGAKTEWWTEREKLDARLRDLLLNIENMWLSGFRGIFSQNEYRPELLARFQQSLTNILDQNLPSRQKQPKGNNTERATLDPWVLELFIGLGRPSEVETNLDEALTDLLYFVIDILQFNGEQIAYDEIDFDAMVIETQDALVSYHEAAKTDDAMFSPKHIILILEKQLQAFPWESMPCLEGRSVSRVPSFVDLRERVLVMRQQHWLDNLRTGVRVSSCCGTYVLNPSGDLTKTQKRFEEPLTSLQKTPHSWVSIIARPPEEDELSNALYDGSISPSQSTVKNRILIYFGHGSGAQYIRHRRIKELRFQRSNPSTSLSRPLVARTHAGAKSTNSAAPSITCNTEVSVALLFGCSSALLRDQGEFETHGTPKSYMLAGAPAFLGSLWDVTDGDLDKFAGAVLERWGLLSEGARRDVSEERKMKGKGKRTAKPSRSHESKYGESGKIKENDWGSMSLSDAAARSRADCYLKYLNGAAMVVYGVPVYLEETAH